MHDAQWNVVDSDCGRCRQSRAMAAGPSESVTSSSSHIPVPFPSSAATNPPYVAAVVVSLRLVSTVRTDTIRASSSTSTAPPAAVRSTRLCLAQFGQHLYHSYSLVPVVQLTLPLYVTTHLTLR